MPPIVTLLYFDGCPLASAVRQERIPAAAAMGLPVEDADLAQLPPDDGRLRYGSPTVLVNGLDVFGLPPASTGGLACRPYPHGVPTRARWADALGAAIRR